MLLARSCDWNVSYRLGVLFFVRLRGQSSTIMFAPMLLLGFAFLLRWKFGRVFRCTCMHLGNFLYNEELIVSKPTSMTILLLFRLSFIPFVMQASLRKELLFYRLDFVFPFLWKRQPWKWKVMGEDRQSKMTRELLTCSCCMIPNQLAIMACQ